MIGLVLVTHGNLAKEFISAMQHVVGRQEQVEAVCIGPEDDMEMRRAEILKKVGEVDKGHGAIVLTDMFGGTPTNLALSLLGSHNVEVVTGVNLPMLLKVFTCREKPLAELAKLAGEAGTKGIVVAGSMLRSRNKEKTGD
jgi:PTS system mannose-specific IIA component